MSIYNRRSRNQPSENSIVDVINLAKCILKYFNQISVERFHKIAFIAEYKHYDDYGLRITPAEYQLVLDGCFSEELSSVINELDKVERGEVTIAGETIKILSVLSEPNCALDSKFEESVIYAVEEYGEVTSEEVDQVIQSLPVYQETKLGDTLDFEQYLD